MRDPHLNLFYSYNHDNELIENNLTRALIVTLRHLGPDLRTRLLVQVLRAATGFGSPATMPFDLDFSHVQFALQGHVERSPIATAKRKYVLVISSMPSLETQNLPKETYPSIPDGWILSPTGEFCLLLESKVGTNPVDVAQITSHAREWLLLDTEDEIRAAVFSSSWEQVCEVLREIIVYAEVASGSPLERDLLFELADFLRLFGYRHFTGLTPVRLHSSPTLRFRPRRSVTRGESLPRVDVLMPRPQVRLRPN